MNDAQLDAILEAYAKDNPKRLKFERKRERKTRDHVEQLSLDWSGKLIGEGQEVFKSKIRFDIPDQFRAIRTRMAPQPNAGSKPIGMPGATMKGMRRRQ